MKYKKLAELFELLDLVKIPECGWLAYNQSLFKAVSESYPTTNNAEIFQIVNFYLSTPKVFRQQKKE